SKKIYVAIDESVHSVAALNFTLNNMARPSDIITVIMITDSEAEREVKIAHAKTLIRALADPNHTDKFFAVRVLCSERAGEAICKLVDETQPDILVLGSSGKSHLESFFLGSVSQYCIQNANCPLVVAR
ncbi:adenine nucleotide alpha hydrolases-like protein, partial [Rhizoclosmatium globosum]